MIAVINVLLSKARQMDKITHAYKLITQLVYGGRSHVASSVPLVTLHKDTHLHITITSYNLKQADNLFIAIINLTYSNEFIKSSSNLISP